MTLTASAAVRSAIMMIAVYVLFVAASVVIMDAPAEYRLRALQRSFTEIPPLATVVAGWLCLVGWARLAPRMPQLTRRGQLARVSWAVVTTLLAAAGFVALFEIVLAISNGFSIIYSWGIPWRYWLRLFEAALFAVALVRISLPLLPRFDRMPSHTA